jgi:hypothetical protein
MSVTAQLRDGLALAVAFVRERNDDMAGRGAGVESVRHFCQLRRNSAFASSMLDARPLVVKPRFGST